MLSFLYCFVVKGKLISSKSLPPVGIEPFTMKQYTNDNIANFVYYGKTRVRMLAYVHRRGPCTDTMLYPMKLSTKLQILKDNLSTEIAHVSEK